jgi:hypothetical protein
MVVGLMGKIDPCAGGWLRRVEWALAGHQSGHDEHDGRAVKVGAGVSPKSAPIGMPTRS